MLSKERLGERVRALRLARGLTLKEFGQAAGLSAPHLCEIEQGKTSPTFGALAKIASALERPVAYLLEEELRPDVSVVRRGDAASATADPVPGMPARSVPLTDGIPSGRLAVHRLVLAPEERAGSVPPGKVADRSAPDGAGGRGDRATTMPVSASRRGTRPADPLVGRPAEREAGRPAGHRAGHQGGVLLRGQVEARVDGEVRLLERGEVAFFDAARPHELRNPGPGPAELLWFRLDAASD